MARHPNQSTKTQVEPSASASDPVRPGREAAHPCAGTGSTGPLPRARYFLLGVVVVNCILQLMLPDRVSLGEWWLGWPLLEAPLGLASFIALRHEQNFAREGVRTLVRVLLIVMVLAVSFNTAMLLSLLAPSDNPNGIDLLLSCAAVLTMNILTFGVVYWWIDSGGPAARRDPDNTRHDLQFPQDIEAEPWQPGPEDYVYTSYTNVFAFSPTDTMPLTRRAKRIFTLQSAVALLTMLVTLGLAVNNLT